MVFPNIFIDETDKSIYNKQIKLNYIWNSTIETCQVLLEDVKQLNLCPWDKTTPVKSTVSRRITSDVGGFL